MIESILTLAELVITWLSLICAVYFSRLEYAGSGVATKLTVVGRALEY